MSLNKNMRVMIVDDYTTMLRILRNLLRQLEIANVDEANDAETAFAAMQRQVPDLIISDWNMVPMTGLDLLRKVRAADAVGARTAIAEWACPGKQATPQLRDARYIAWINEIIAEVARTGRAEGADVTVLAPTDRICVDGDPLGDPTPRRAEATDDEIHVANKPGGLWLWSSWIVPALRRGS